MRATVLFNPHESEQRRWGLWIELCLRDAGVEVRRWHVAGKDWVQESHEVASDPSETVFVLVIGQPEAVDTRYAATWRGVVAAGADRPLVPVCVNGAKATGLLANRIPVHLSGASAEAATATLLDAVGLLEPDPGNVDAFGTDRIAVDTGDVLPRLRRISERAWRDTGTVGSRTFEWSPDSETHGLYVRRDIQDRVMSLLGTESLVVVSGQAGTGKSSLLWGIAAELLSGSEQDVFFVRAAMLVGRSGAAPLVTPRLLRSAVAQCRREGGRPYVLIDTADILVHDQTAFLNLMEIIDTTVAGQATVVLTSRPEEAARITAGGTRPIELSPYSDTPPGDGQLSELERAVARHALAYCRRPGDTSLLAEQITVAVIRKQALESIARLPLTLRMLFELYAPGEVAETVDATSLFEQYWLDRVYQDRRLWASDTAENQDDLTRTSMRLAHQMLKTGIPEISVDDLPADGAADRLRLRREIDTLCARGVGRLGEFGIFSFFHQTFFEFCAAKDLLAGQSTVLELLARRVLDRTGDYFLLSVFEQTWICAWRDARHTIAAAHLAESVLSGELERSYAEQHSTDVTRSFGLHRCCLLVLAQSAVGPDTREVLVAALGAENTEKVVVTEYLAHLPGPRRLWDAKVDAAVLASCFNRPDASWHSVIGVLARLAAVDPGLAMATTEELYDRTAPRRIVGVDSIGLRPTRELLSDLTSAFPDRVLALLDHAMTDDPAVGRAPTLPNILELLDVASDAAARIAAWSDAVTGRRSTDSETIGNAARLHARALAVDYDHHVWPELWRRFGAALRTIAVRDDADAEPVRVRISVGECAFAWGLLLALESRYDTIDGITAGDEERIAVAMEILTVHDGPLLHAEVHHGWLIGLLNRSPIVRSRAVDIMLRGLPAAHNSPEGPGRRWADTTRRMLERADADYTVVADICERVEDELARRNGPIDVWADPDILLRLLLPAASGGCVRAQDALARASAGEMALDDSAIRILTQQGQRLRMAGAKEAPMLELLVERSAYIELEQMTRAVSELRLSPSSARAIRRSALRDLRSPAQLVRRPAANFLEYVVVGELVEGLSWAEISGILADCGDAVVRIHLYEIAVHAVARGSIAAGEVIEAIRLRLGPVSDVLVEDHESINLRALLVRLLARHGEESDVPEMLRLAFVPPVVDPVITSLAGYLTPAGRSSEPPIRTRVDLIVEVGRRLARPGTSKRAQRNVPGRWKPIFAQVLHHADDDSLLALLAALSAMPAVYAAGLVSRLPRRPSLPVVARLTEMAHDNLLAGEVRRQIGFALEHMRLASGAWPTLDADLAATDSA
ncbi:NACHT domain-containing protein [Nocardia fluminea]|uniref:NACHT domain-containing protein n=1 Tax=Nocardia fluminea TaxID=134984 RepID=UPI003671A07E